MRALLALPALLAALAALVWVPRAGQLFERNAVHVEALELLGTGQCPDDARARATISHAEQVQAERLAGIVAYCRGEYGAAISFFERAAATDPDNQTLSWLGDARYASGDTAAALQDWRQVNPTRFASRLVGRAADSNNGPRIVALSQDALALSPGLISAYVELGRGYSLQQDWENAIIAFRAAVEAAPPFASTTSYPYEKLAEAYSRTGDLPAARAVLEGALQRFPTAFYARVSLADVDVRLGNLEEARGHYLRALELRPQDATAYVGLGRVELLEGHAEAAADWYRRGAEADSSGQGHWAVGNLLLTQRDYAGAVDYLERAVALGWQYSWVWWDLATAYRGVSRPGDAEAAYQRAIQRADSPEIAVLAQCALLDLYQEEAKLDAAAQLRSELRNTGVADSCGR